jgi:cellulose synthase/poly-beta-1,6-N-acetylglucosamine synthase-like glycosyltransferase
MFSGHGDPCSPGHHGPVGTRDVTTADFLARRVSVILPTLNERAFIRDCLESLVHQQACDIDEILVVDGGSTDGTRDNVDAMG